jgi:hypothetical protein
MTLPFSLLGRGGTVTVVYRANDDPERWGYSVLGLAWPPRLAEGLPVLEARVSSPLEGYAAVMGWIQVVRIHVSEASTSLVAGGWDVAASATDSRQTSVSHSGATRATRNHW